MEWLSSTVFFLLYLVLVQYRSGYYIKKIQDQELKFFDPIVLPVFIESALSISDGIA